MATQPPNGNNNHVLHNLAEDVRAIRNRLDQHIDDEGADVKTVLRDIGKIREDMAGFKAKLAILSSVLAIGVSVMVSFIIDHVKLP